MAKKKDTSVDLAFTEFDTLVNTFFKEAASSLEELQAPNPPKEPRKKQARLPNPGSPFRI